MTYPMRARVGRRNIGCHELVCAVAGESGGVRGTGSARTVRARLIRELLTGRHGSIDPAGLRLRGARITGRLDFDHVRAGVSLFLRDCGFTEPLSLTSARLRHLDLTGSKLVAIDSRGLGLDADLVLRKYSRFDGRCSREPRSSSRRRVHRLRRSQAQQSPRTGICR